MWINVAVPLGLCALVGLAALVPALRAGRMSAVATVATGHAPRQGGGYAAHRLLGRLRLPRPVTIGLAAPFARPARSAATAAAILFGLTAVALAVHRWGKRHGRGRRSRWKRLPGLPLPVRRPAPGQRPEPGVGRLVNGR